MILSSSLRDMWREGEKDMMEAQNEKKEKKLEKEKQHWRCKMRRKLGANRVLSIWFFIITS